MCAAAKHAEGVPGLAGAIAVDHAFGERIAHVGWRQHDDLDITVRIDAARRQPVAQFVIVPGIGMHDGKTQRRARLRIDRLAQGCTVRARIEIRGRAVFRHPLPERRRHRHRIAAETQRHRHDHFRGRHIEAEIAGDRHGPENMRHIDMANRKSVADARPGALTQQGQVDPLFFGKAHLAGDNEQGAVEERHETGGDGVARRHSFPPGSSRLAAVTRLWAMSTILRFWFIAVRRSGA